MICNVISIVYTHTHAHTRTHTHAHTRTHIRTHTHAHTRTHTHTHTHTHTQNGLKNSRSTSSPYHCELVLSVCVWRVCIYLFISSRERKMKPNEPYLFRSTNITTGEMFACVGPPSTERCVDGAMHNVSFHLSISLWWSILPISPSDLLLNSSWK